jgi:hypothetical protein
MNTFVLYYILGNVGGQIYFFSREREPPKVSILRVIFFGSYWRAKHGKGS